MLHSVNTQTVDVVLAIILLIGGVCGAQVGPLVGVKLKGEQLRALLAALVMLVCIKMGYDLVIMPSDLYSISSGAAH